MTSKYPDSLYFVCDRNGSGYNDRFSFFDLTGRLAIHLVSFPANTSPPTAYFHRTKNMTCSFCFGSEFRLVERSMSRKQFSDQAMMYHTYDEEPVCSLVSTIA